MDRRGASVPRRRLGGDRLRFFFASRGGGGGHNRGARHRGRGPRSRSRRDSPRTGGIRIRGAGRRPPPDQAGEDPAASSTDEAASVVADPRRETRGTGRSALVVEWLSLLRAAGYRARNYAFDNWVVTV